MRWLGQSPNNRIYGSLLRAKGLFITLLGKHGTQALRHPGIWVPRRLSAFLPGVYRHATASLPRPAMLQAASCTESVMK
jgi:hypothetical protein